MTKLSLRFAGLFCLLFSLLSAVAQTPPTISKIEIQHIGPPTVSDAFIRANIRVKEGDPYLRASIDDDIRNLYGTGFFNNVRVAEDVTGDKVKLTYIVQGKLLLTDIKFSGNKKFSVRKLKKKLTAKVGQPLDNQKLFSDALEMQKAYQKSGYQKTTVKPVVSPDENAGRATVTFEIVEGPKVHIQDIKFVGASAFPEKRLRKVLKTKRHWMFSWLTGSANFKDEQFEDDKEKLIEFYQNEGYIDFEIKDVQFDYITPTKLIIRFIISEGTRYKVGNITFKGNTLFSTNEIYNGIRVAGRTKKMEMLVGKIFTPKGLQKDTQAIEDFYGAKGYIGDGNGIRILAQKNANTLTGTMDLVYNIDEGIQSFIEKIEIKGNDKTKDKVIRRELAVSPGEVYDMVRVKLSKERLEGLRYFEKVDTQSDETDVPNRKNLVIGVEEKNTGNFTIGAGLSSVDSVVGFVEVSQENFDLFKPPTFTGAGQKFRLRAQLGTQRQDYQMTFIEPWFLGKKLQLGVDLYYRDLGFLSDLYTETHAGGTLSLTKALGSENLIGRVAYTLESVNVQIDSSRHTNAPVVTHLGVTNSTMTNATSFTTNAPNISKDIFEEGGRRLVSKFGTSIAYDTRNDIFLATRGQRSELSGELAGGPFGGDTDFYKIEGKSVHYFPGFFEGHILELAGQAGVVASYGNGDRGRDRVPIFDRWFLGGLYSLRGYKYRDVGPQDEFSQPLGGDTYWFGSAEYSIPIIERLRFALFYDIGNVYAQPFSLNPGQIRDGKYAGTDRGFYEDNWGIGLRINIPYLGPLRLDYGFPLTHDKNLGDKGRFNFGVGFQSRF